MKVTPLSVTKFIAALLSLGLLSLAIRHELIALRLGV
jgi:hypothetical protein